MRPAISHNLSSQQRRIECSGMTLFETLIAVLMLVVFTGVVAMVMEFTFRFLGEAESGMRNELGVSNGVLIEHQEIHFAMDQLVEVLSQPGLSRERLNGTDPSYAQIAFDPETSPHDACIDDPVSRWGLPIPKIYLPPGYRLCLWTTSAEESSMTSLLASKSGAKPGIYLLQALPEVFSASKLSTRRLFCRPRPFC